MMFKYLFKKRSKPNEKQENSNQKNNVHFSNEPEIVPAEQLVIDIELEAAFSKIVKKMKANEKQMDINYKKAKQLMFKKRNYEQADKLTRQDVTSYFNIYEKASKEEEKGNLLEAIRLYWKNIYINGTDARGNYDRLLILLSKLKRHEEELRVAELYLMFIKYNPRVGNKDKLIEKTQRRIEKLKNKITN